MVSDQVVAGLPHIHKLVDDILVVGETFEHLLANMERVLERCKEFNLHLNRKKLQVGKQVKFAGFSVFEGGYKPLPEKLAAIHDFKTPQTVTDIKSFLGLVNHLSISNPDISQAAAPMRGLLKKDTAFVWTPVHQQSFDKVKEIILSPQVVHFYDPRLPIEIYCDAAGNAGLGYVMLQRDEVDENAPSARKNTAKKWLIKCGSRSLTDCETRYSATELELLGLTYAVKECNYYLLFGPKFKVFTDHKALEGLFLKRLGDIENTRLQRLREKVLHYDFTVHWLPGKNNVVADVLSRNPVFKPSPEEDEESKLLQTVNICALRHIAQRVPDLAFDKMESEARADREYSRLVGNVISYEPGINEDVWGGYPSLFKPVFGDLALTTRGSLVMYHERLIPPKSMQKELVDNLHRGHPGISKMLSTARKLYYWPGMTLQIQHAVKSCKECTKMLPSLPKDNSKVLDLADEPMEILGMDIFTVTPNNYLVVVDFYSKYFFVRKLSSMSTEEVVKHVLRLFREYGYPRMVVSDNGPAFRSSFTSFLKENEIHHRVSSPYYPQANGNAEAAVKRAKYLMLKVGVQKFPEELMHYLALNADGWKVSPAEVFFGRNPRIPGLPRKSYAWDRDKKIERPYVHSKLPPF